LDASAVLNLRIYFKLVFEYNVAIIHCRFFSQLPETFKTILIILFQVIPEASAKKPEIRYFSF